MFEMPWKRKPADVPEAADEPTVPDAAASDARAADDAPVTRTLYAARQPILNRVQQLEGYELLFRGGPENRFDGADADFASAATIEQSASAFGLDAIVGDRRAFLNLTRRALLAGYHRMLPPERTVIELLETVEPDREVLDACTLMRAEGYRIALDDYTFRPESEPLLDVVDLVKVDLRAAPQALDPRALMPLTKRRLLLLAEKVETHEEHLAAKQLGYQYFQGYYFFKPQMISTRDLPPSKLSALKFMAEMSREDVTIDALEQVFKHDPGLTVRLLRYLNSAAFGWRHEIGSLRHALAVIGARPLRQWALMIGLLSCGNDKPHELSLTALSRARFAERLAPTSGLQEHQGELFLGGLLSLVDAMVGRPMEEVLKGLAVSERVRAALLGREGPLAPPLQLVSAYQIGDWAAVEASRRECRVDDRALGEAYVDSLAWAEATATM